MKKDKNHRFGTRAVHGGVEPDPSTGAIMTPIYQTSTYAQNAPGEHKGFEYSRTQNPTRIALEKSIATLEGGEYGIAFSSGMAAISSVIQLLKAGDHVVCSDDVYGGTFRLFDKIYKNFGLEFSFVDTSNPENIKKGLTEKTVMIWLETPTNPTLKVTDLKEASAIAKKHKALMVVDNTFMSPYFQRPLELGADIVLHSTTKYIAGHSDIIGGAIVANDSDLAEKLYFIQNAAGAVPGPMDCFLTLRGIKTLHLRMERHEHNARKIFEYLKKQPAAKKIYYPGDPDHPGHEIQKKQSSGFGSIVSFDIGTLENARRFMSELEVFTIAESLGSVESLIEHPAIMTHASVPPENRAKLGITDGFIRISVGVEDIDDLLDDLGRGLGAIK
ncbi:MAG: cystathionine gamma-synthase [Candidatus Zixiibacteriota bacterium]|nr:MAG: cystathionine gamma-synthase [candidate division Zixibacteria bacterium]